MAKKPDAAAEGILKPAKKKSNGKPEAKKPRVQIAAEDLPRRTLKDSLAIPVALHENYAGKSASWEEIASVLGVSATNPNNRYPLWAAEAYGVIKKDEAGTYSLTENGRRIVAPTYPGENNEAFLQAIQTPAILGRFYAEYNGNPVPPDENLLNLLESNRYGVPRPRREEAAHIIVDNARDAGILLESDGKRSINLRSSPASTQLPSLTEQSPAEASSSDLPPSDYSTICFFITPIGNEGSEERKHSDMILKHLIVPVLKEFEGMALEVIRADKIGKPGLINQQIIEHLARSRLCIADLSFNNPNAFYEIGVRHTFLLPTIQIIRKTDKIPFDVAQGRTITIDTSDPYTIMDRFASAREELKEHVSASLGASHTNAKDNPISYYLPGLKITIPLLQPGE